MIMLLNKLPELMDEHGVSIRQLSRMTGITYTTVRAVYHGERRSVQLEVLEKICLVLGVQPGDIYQLETREEVESDRGPDAEVRPPKDAPGKKEPARDETGHRDWRQW